MCEICRGWKTKEMVVGTTSDNENLLNAALQHLQLCVPSPSLPCSHISRPFSCAEQQSWVAAVSFRSTTSPCCLAW